MEYVIVVFLLFFAVLAFGWFYLQRAKARDAASTTSGETSTTASTTRESSDTEAPSA